MKHPGSKYLVAEHAKSEHGKSLAGHQQVAVCPPLCLNPLEVEIPLFLLPFQFLPVIKRPYSGMVQKLALDQLKVCFRIFFQPSLSFARVILHVS